MSAPAEKNIRFHLGIPLIGMSFLLLFILGSSSPDYWWATHFPAFLKPEMRTFFFLASTALIAWPLFSTKKGSQTAAPTFLNNIRNVHWLIAAIALGMGGLFYTFPIAVDFYGNSYLFTPKLEQTVPEFPSEALGEISVSYTHLTLPTNRFV